MLISTDVESVKKEISNYKIDDRTIADTRVARFHPEKTKNFLIDLLTGSSEGFQCHITSIGNGYDSKEGKLLKNKLVIKIYF